MNGEGSLFTQFGFNCDTPAMSGDDLFTNGESRACARDFTFGGLHTIKFFQTGGVGLWPARSCQRYLW
jgi:hypothetical protein